MRAAFFLGALLLPGNVVAFGFQGLGQAQGMQEGIQKYYAENNIPQFAC